MDYPVFLSLRLRSPFVFFPAFKMSLQDQDTLALSTELTEEDVNVGLRLAIDQAMKSLGEGGIPIGASLYHHPTKKILAVGHNQRVQMNSNIRHGETDCLENLGRVEPGVLRECTMYSTLSPCVMCSSTILLYGIPRVVMAENENFQGGEDLLRSPPSSLAEPLQKARIVINARSEEATRMMGDWIKSEAGAKVWWEDIGLKEEEK